MWGDFLVVAGVLVIVACLTTVIGVFAFMTGPNDVLDVGDSE